MKKLLVLLLIYSSAYSQVTKITSSVGVNYSSGNTGLALGTFNGTIKRDSSKSSWSISPYICYSQIKSGNDWTVRQREAYVTGSYTLRKAKWSLYLFTDDETSYQKKFNFKGSLGIGIGTNLYNDSQYHVGFSIGVMPEYYISSYNVEQRTVRLSARIKLETKGVLKLSSITVIQPPISMRPKLSMNDNMSIRSTNSLSYPVAKNLSIGLQVLVSTFTLSSYLDPRLKSTDITSSFTLTYSR